LRKVTLRLHDDLYTEVQAQAKEHHRSMNGEITVVLAAYVAREQMKSKKKKGGKADD